MASTADYQARCRVRWLRKGPQVSSTPGSAFSTRSGPRPPGAVHEVCPRFTRPERERRDCVRGPHGGV